MGSAVLGDSNKAKLGIMVSMTHNNVITANKSSWHRNYGFLSKNNSHPLHHQNKLNYVGIKLPHDIPHTLQIMHSDKEINANFVCNHLIPLNNGSQAEVKELTSTTTEAALYSLRGKNNNNSNGNKCIRNQSNSSKRCKSGFHNSKQDANHSSDNYWHLHPDKAPDWWKESHAQWKAGKEKENLEMGIFDVIKSGKRIVTLTIKGRIHTHTCWKQSWELDNQLCCSP
ncbi:hypothetical protein VP01_1155g2 [Puccinia sorghi]|uniref:Uncharacterized protein n=1 Tax=Puccinia sorghi TaxID=27349 RepID=A0A0L6VRP0_9BASI|nr:hypothetical protein VP01_1155g2 [Puccinia sorghi]